MGEDNEWEDDGVGCTWGSETMLDGLLRSKKLMNSKQVSHHPPTLGAVPSHHRTSMACAAQCSRCKYTASLLCWMYNMLSPTTCYVPALSPVCYVLCMQVQHVDWTAGEIAIPEFHCQRCRDHWYGLTHYPCDEELARLIRQGLWATGQGPVDRNLLLGGRGSLAVRDRRHILKEGGGGNKLNLPPIVDRTDSGTSLDGSRSGGGRHGGKKGRRITFNMQTEEFVYSQEGGEAGGAGGRSSSEGAQLNTGQRGEREEPEGSSHQTGAASSQSLSSQKVGRQTEETGSGGTVQLAGDKAPEGMSLHRQKAAHPWQDGPPAVGGRQHSSGGIGSTSSHADVSGCGSTGSNDEGTHSSGRPSNEGTSKFGWGAAHMDGGVHSGEWHREGEGALSNSRNGSMACNNPKDASSTTVDGSSAAAGGGRGHSWSHWRQGSDCSEESGGEGDGKPTTASCDVGKNVRVQGAGFIARASSPTGSEWGDPTHALRFISNTTCSSRAGSSLGGRFQSDELGKTQSAPELPQARPKLTTGDFIWGPSLTHAFTFSYHRQVPPARQPAATNRGRNKPTKRRK